MTLLAKYYHKILGEANRELWQLFQLTPYMPVSHPHPLTCCVEFALECHWGIKGMLPHLLGALVHVARHQPPIPCP